MKQQFLLITLVIGALAGCSKPTAKTSPPPTAHLSAAEWHLAFDRTFKKQSFEDKGSGKSSYTVNCVEIDHCFFFVEHDAFAKLTTLMPEESEMTDVGSIKFPSYAYARSVLYVPDCGLPFLALNAHYFSKRAWLMMNRLAILADDQLVLDHQFPSAHRNAEDYGLEEDFSFPVTAAEIQKLRTVLASSKILIRVSGEKGYLMIDKKQADLFRDALISSIQGLDLLTSSLKGADVNSCA